jgi:hypothetical protein
MIGMSGNLPQEMRMFRDGPLSKGAATAQKQVGPAGVDQSMMF